MAALAKSGIPSPCSVPLMETDRINTQRAAAPGQVGDICQLGAGGWSPAAQAAPGLRMVITGGAVNGVPSFGAGDPITPLNPGVRMRFADSKAAIVPGTLFYLDAATPGGLADAVNGAPLARALANSKGVFEGVIELL